LSLTEREENRLRRLYEIKREEEKEDEKKLFSEKLQIFKNIIMMIKSRRIRSAGHVARKGETRNAYTVLIGERKVKRPLTRLGVDGRIILKYIINRV
jgi:hypothetical protein